MLFVIVGTGDRIEGQSDAFVSRLARRLIGPVVDELSGAWRVLAESSVDALEADDRVRYYSEAKPALVAMVRDEIARDEASQAAIRAEGARRRPLRRDLAASAYLDGDESALGAGPRLGRYNP